MIALFCTYNSVGRSPLQNGRYERKGNVAYVYQGFLRKNGSSKDLTEKLTVLHQVWQELWERVGKDQLHVDDINYLVINCGKLPNVAMNLPRGFSPSAVKFVHCGCGEAINASDERILGAGYVYTACGGVETMNRIYERYMNYGQIVSYMTVAEAMRPKGV